MAEMTLRELLIKIGFNVQDAGLKKADASINSMRRGVLWLGTAITGMATAMGGLVYSTAEYATELSKTASMLGMSTKELQELRGAAELAHVDTEKLTMGMRFFGRITGEALRGSKAGMKAFAEVGITSFRNANGTVKTQMQLLEEVADRIVALRNPQLQLAAIFKLFSRGGTSMLPFLKEGSMGIKELIGYFDAFGYVLTEKDIKASKQFKVELSLLKLFFSGLKNQIGAQLLPAFNDYLTIILKFVKAHREMIKQNLGAFFQFIGKVLKIVGIALYAVINSLDTLVNMFGGWNKVLTVTGILLGGLITYKIINGFVSLAASIVKATVALFSMDAAAGFLAALPALILLLAGVMYLAYDDFKHFEDGQKSFVGTLQKNHPIIFKVIQGMAIVFEYLSNALKIAVDTLINLGNSILWVITLVGKLLTKIPIVGKVFESIGNSFDNMGNMFTGAIDRLDQFNKSGYMTPENMPFTKGIIPYAFAGNAAPTAATQKQVTVNSSPTVNITVPAGTPDFQKDWFKDTIKDYINDTLQTEYQSATMDNPKLWEGT